MGKGTYFVSGLAVGVFATRFIFKHKNEIEAFLGLDSSDNTDNMFNNKISMDESIADNIKKGYYAIAKTYAGGDSDRDGSKTYSKCVSFESEEAIVEGEASDSYEDSESPFENEETEEPVYLVDDIENEDADEESVPEDREILGFQTQSDGSMVCTLDFNKKDREFYNSVTGDLIPKDLVIKYISTYDFNVMANDHDTSPKIRIVHNSMDNINFIIKY